MPSNNIEKSHRQKRLFYDEMSVALDKNNKLYKLRGLINWKSLEAKILPLVKISHLGRMRKSPRVMIGISMLQAMYNYSDNQASAAFSENTYWQYFCGHEYFEPEDIISEATIRRFRNLLGEEGYNIILAELIESGIKSGAIKKKDLESVIVDTTVQSKNIKHPNDVVLLGVARQKLVDLCHELGIKLNETYAKRFKKVTLQIWKYKTDSKAKKKHKARLHLKTLLGRLIRVTRRNIVSLGMKLDEKSSQILSKVQKIYDQSILSKSEKQEYKAEGNEVIYSFHEEAVECIGKGKLHKPYEFGNKVSIAVSGKKNFVLCAKSFHGNPYDGHTLKQTIESLQQNSKVEVQKAFVDLGYRGHNYSKKGKVYTAFCKKKLSDSDKKMQKRRNSIEPVIGHLKQHGRMARNYLKGVIGDIINPLISAVGFNLRKLANKLVSPKNAPT